MLESGLPYHETGFRSCIIRTFDRTAPHLARPSKRFYSSPVALRRTWRSFSALDRQQSSTTSVSTQRKATTNMEILSAPEALRSYRSACPSCPCTPEILTDHPRSGSQFRIHRRRPKTHIRMRIPHIPQVFHQREEPVPQRCPPDRPITDRIRRKEPRANVTSARSDQVVRSFEHYRIHERFLGPTQQIHGPTHAGCTLYEHLAHTAEIPKRRRRRFR